MIELISRTRRFLGSAFLMVLCVTAAISVATGTEQDPPRHTLIYGGDFFSARRLHFALYDEQERYKVLAGVAAVLRDADIAMLNLEGMVTTGGYYNTLRSCTWMFRAHPLVLDLIKDAGVDMLIIGNNHNGDYGPEAQIEETDHLVRAGLDYTGAGVNWDDAARPVYRQVGDVTIAILGMEMTVGEIYVATENTAGLHFLHRAFVNDADDDRLVAYLTEQVKEMRQHAHVVILSPHWDANQSVPSVTQPMRDMARRLIVEAGFDAILAHGRHHLQGVEVFDGRPVTYDAGNCVIDFDARPQMDEDRRGMLWQIEFSRAGVHKLEGIPIEMDRNRTWIATGSAMDKALGRVERLSKDYDTNLRIQDGRAYLDLDPGRILPPPKPDEIPRRAPRASVRRAPNDILHEKLPEGVTPIDLRFENGIRLVGYEMLSPSIQLKKGSSETVVLYWQTDKPIKDSYIIHLDAREVHDGQLCAEKIIRKAYHLPGDWMLPTNLWPVGKIIQDKLNVRLPLSHEPSGEVAFFVGLRTLDLGKMTAQDLSIRDGEILTPSRHDGLELLEGKLAPLARVPYSKDAPHPRQCYRQWRETRKITLCPEQPWDAPPLYWHE